MNVFQIQHLLFHLQSEFKTCEITLILELIWWNRFRPIYAQSWLYDLLNQEIGRVEMNINIVCVYFNLYSFHYGKVFFLYLLMIPGKIGESEKF